MSAELRWPPLRAVDPATVKPGQRLYGDGNTAGRPWRLHTVPTAVTKVTPLGHATKIEGNEPDGTTGFTLITQGSQAVIEIELCGGCGVYLHLLPERQVNRGCCTDCLPR
jgi:hypothetical protein